MAIIPKGIPIVAIVATGALIFIIVLGLFIMYAPFRELMGYIANQFWFISSALLFIGFVYYITSNKPVQVRQWVYWKDALGLSFTRFHIENEIHCRMHDLASPLQPTELPNSGRWHIQVPQGWMGNTPGWSGIIIQGVKEDGKPEPGFVWGHTEYHLEWPLRHDIIAKLDEASDPVLKTLTDYTQLKNKLTPVIEEHGLVE